MFDRVEQLWWRIKNALGRTFPSLKTSVVAWKSW